MFMNLTSFLSRLSANQYLVAVSNVFIMALPISLIATFCNLISMLCDTFGYDGASAALGYVGQITGHMFPILLNIFLATYISSVKRIPKAASISSSLVAFFIISHQWNLISPVIPMPNNFALSLISAYATCLVLARLKRFRSFNIEKFNSIVDNSVNMIVTCALAIGSVVSVCYLIKLTLRATVFELPFVLELDLTSFGDGLVYEFIRGLLWSVGINGHNILHLFKTELYDITVANMADWQSFGSDLNIISTNFYDFFTGMGGSGNTISLVL